MGDILRVCGVYAAVGDPWSKVAEWLFAREGQDVLIALDAPLGWPDGLGKAISRHLAGNPIIASSNDVFRRFTDRQIKKLIDKQPLDVGADRIARTAHAALKELDALRNRCHSPIPLAWSKDDLEGIQAIEVYPAATLKSHGLPHKGYKEAKDSKHRAIREEIAKGLPGVEIPDNYLETVLDSADGLDAVVCLIAAADFLRGDASVPPDNKFDVARREGWIWCKKNQSQSL